MFAAFSEGWGLYAEHLGREVRPFYIICFSM